MRNKKNILEIKKVYIAIAIHQHYLKRNTLFVYLNKQNIKQLKKHFKSK